MEDSISRSLYRLLPFMFLFQFLAFVSLICLFGSAGGLDLSTTSYDIPGLSGTCILLPLAFIFTVINLVVFPRLKSEEPALLLFIVEIIVSGALAVEAFQVLYTLFIWMS